MAVGLAGVVDQANEAGGGGGVAPHPPGTGDRPVRPDGGGGCFGQGPVRGGHARRLSTRLPARFRRRQRRPHLRQEVSAPCPTLLVAGEREAKAVRAANAALAALLPNAAARFAPGRGHGWLAVEPELHCRMVAVWITGQELPVELPIETTAWSRGKVARVLGRAVAELGGASAWG